MSSATVSPYSWVSSLSSIVFNSAETYAPRAYAGSGTSISTSYFIAPFFALSKKLFCYPYSFLLPDALATDFTFGLTVYLIRPYIFSFSTLLMAFSTVFFYGSPSIIIFLSPLSTPSGVVGFSPYIEPRFFNSMCSNYSLSYLTRSSTLYFIICLRSPTFIWILLVFSLFC
jgi:hypothetical protein